MRPTDFEHGATAEPELPRVRVKPDVVEDLGSESHVIFTLDAPRVTAEAVRAATEQSEDEGKLFAGDRAIFTACVDARRPVANGAEVELAVDYRRPALLRPGDGPRAAARPASSSPPVKWGGVSTHYSASHSFTLRVRLDDRPGSFADLARAIADAGGLLDAIDLVRVDAATKIRDISVFATDAEHADRIVAACGNVAGVEVERVSDRTFLLHLGGKIHMNSNAPVKTRDDLSMAYTPGVARVCLAIADDPESAWNLTIKRNTVAVVTDGSAVLGLGDIGPEAAMPVMEGKALLFKEFGGIDAWPLCLATKDTDEIVATVQAIAPGFGGINLEDIAAPRCFEVEDRLRASLDIPVFHDDQHGTAIVVLAAFLNALRVVDKRIEDVKVVVTGVGAAGIAVTRTLQAAGVRNVIGCDSVGAVYRGRTGLTAVKERFAEETNPENVRGSAVRRARGRRRLHRPVAAGAP